jgi:enediyne polyketide synthase
LLVSYLQRRLGELLAAPVPALLVVRCTDNEPDRRRRSEATVDQLTGAADQLCWRPDGKPELSGGAAVSIAHCEDLVLVVTGAGPLGCDLEQVSHRSEQTWCDLLGRDRLALAQQVAGEAEEELDIAATRLWTVFESLKKAGAMPDTPLVLAEIADDGWVLVAAGSLTCATGLLDVTGCEHKLVIGLALAAGADT